MRQRSNRDGKLAKWRLPLRRRGYLRGVGGEVNQNLVEALKKEYGLDAAKTNFKNLTLAEIPQAIKAKQVSALLGVMPLTDKYLTMLRGFFPKTGLLGTCHWP